MEFERDVFVNCPFDSGYRDLLESVLFTIVYLGFEPRIVLEIRDSGQPRIEKIMCLIRDSKYAVHDLSRIRADAAGDLFRLNMAFELGMDFGCRAYGAGRLRQKKCLILGAEGYRYQAALSDLSGSDIQVHGNEPRAASREVRNWLGGYMAQSADASDHIWAEFNRFLSDASNHLRSKGQSTGGVQSLEVGELKQHIHQWVRDRACQPGRSPVRPEVCAPVEPERETPSIH